MVDFAKLLARRRAARKHREPRAPENPIIHSGTCKAFRTHHRRSERRAVVCSWTVCKFDDSYVLRLTNGAVTGHEGFYLTDIHMGGVWRLVLEWRVVGQDQIESRGFSIHLEVLRHASCPHLVFKERGLDEECRLFLKAKHRVLKQLENNTALLVAGRWLP